MRHRSSHRHRPAQRAYALYNRVVRLTLELDDVWARNAEVIARRLGCDVDDLLRRALPLLDVVAEHLAERPNPVVVLRSADGEAYLDTWPLYGYASLRPATDGLDGTG